jgi:hypothetical protein
MPGGVGSAGPAPVGGSDAGYPVRDAPVAPEAGGPVFGGDVAAAAEEALAAADTEWVSADQLVVGSVRAARRRWV